MSDVNREGEAGRGDGVARERGEVDARGREVRGVRRNREIPVGDVLDGAAFWSLVSKPGRDTILGGNIFFIG